MPNPGACDAGGGYGLRLSADLAWDSSNALADSGRGPVELYALVQVERVDPQTHAITASGRVCGISLPPNGSSLTCGLHQWRFADKLWDQREMPKLNLEGSYECRPDGCTLQLAPTTYILGIQHDPPQSPWPSAGTTPVSQFPDHDADGLPGVTTDVVSQATVSMGNAACSYTPLGAAAGMPNNGSDDGSVMLGLRAQLTAAMSLAPDCHVAQATGGLQSLDLRAAGCVLRNADWSSGMGAGAGAMKTETPCPEELRLAVDQGVPNYQVLNAGQAPTASPSGRDTSISRGTVLRAMRFAPGDMPTCEQVRMATR